MYPFPLEQQVYQPHRKFTDPTPTREYMLSDNSQQLDVDLDAYSTTDFDHDEREPTLSFVTTTSTVDSTTGTPVSINGEYQFKSEHGKGKEGAPRIRMRTTAGRANAYSSAESSTDSGAYSYHAFADNNLYHPHPPPLPAAPSYANGADHVGLGITSHDFALSNQQRDSVAESSPSSAPPQSPSHSFAHRPWKRDVINRLRSDSASSSLTTASTDSGHSANAHSTSNHSLPYPYAAYASNLPWENEDQMQASEAVALVDEGKERIFDATRLEEIGGLQALSNDQIRSLSGRWYWKPPKSTADGQV